MEGLTDLILACAAFVGSHFAMSHPLRAGMVRRLGEKGFQGIYSLVSFATLAWVAYAYHSAAKGAPLWPPAEGPWIAATVLMWVASVLLVGSFAKNPALPDPNAARNLYRPIQGVFAITRHPMMWGFALWGVAHIIAMPTPAQIVLAGAIILLALVGAKGQDAKKELLMGEGWKAWEARTSFWPLALQLTGRLNWGAAIPSLRVLLIGTLVWIGVSFAHGAIGAGIWRWLG